jgi:dihydroneopterin aldolase
MHKIHLKGVRAYGYVGLLPEEKILGQWFSADVVIYTDFERATHSDSIEDTLDYRWCIQQIEELIRNSKFDLIEKLAGVIGDALIAHPKIHKLELTITKYPPIPDYLGSVGVEIVRTKPPGE